MEVSQMIAAIEAMADTETAEARSINDRLHELLPEPKCVQPPNYLASIDAALTLVPDDFWCNIGVRRYHGEVSIGLAMTAEWFGRAATPALAICAAALRARENQHG